MSSSSSTAPASAPRPGKPARRRRRMWLIACVVLVVAGLLAIGLVAALLPAMLSAGLFQKRIGAVVDDSIEGSVRWDALHLAWGRGQRIEGLEILDANGQVIVHAPQVDAPDVSLWSLAWGGRNLGQVTLTVDQASIIQDEEGRLNVVEALTLKEPAAPVEPRHEPLEGWKVQAKFRGSGIHIQPWQSPAMEVTTLDLDADLSDPAKQIALSLDMALSRDQQPAGQAKGNVTLSQLMDAYGDLQPAQASINVSLAVDRLPVALLATLLGQDQALPDTLGDTLQAQLAIDGPLLTPRGQLALRTPQLEASAALTSTDDMMQVTPGRIIQFTLSEKGLHAWTGDAQTRLDKPVVFNVMLDQLAIPRRGMGFDWPAMKLAMSADASTISMQGRELGTLSLEGLKLALRSDALGKQVTLDAGAAARRDGRAGQFKLSAQLSQLVDDQGRWDFHQLSARGQLQADHLPLALLDQLLATPGRWVALAGPTLDADATVQISPDGQDAAVTGPFEVTFRSDNLQGRLKGSLSRQALALDDQTAIALKLTPAGAQALGLTDGMLQSPGVIRLKVAQAFIPRTDAGLALRDARLNATVASEPLVFQGVGQVRRLVIEKLDATLATDELGRQARLAATLATSADGVAGSLNAQATANHLLQDDASKSKEVATVQYTLQADKLPIVMLDALAGWAGTLERTLGPTLEVALQGQVAKPAESWLDNGQATFTLRSANLRADVQADLDHGKLHTTPTSRIELTLPADGLAQQGLTLAKPITATATLGRIVLPMSPWKLEDAAIERLTLQTTPAILAGDLQATGYSLSAMEGQVASSRLGDRLTVKLEGHASRPGVADSPLKLDVQLNEPLGDKPTGQATLSLEKVAVPMIDAILGQGGFLTDLLGPSLDRLELAIQTPQLLQADDARWQFNLAGQTTYLRIPSLTGSFTPGQAIDVQPGPKLQLRISPALYGRLMAEPASPSSPVGGAHAQAEQAGRKNPIKSLLSAVIPQSAAAKAQREHQPPEAYELASPVELAVEIRQARLRLDTPAGNAAEAPFDLDTLSLDILAQTDAMTLARKKAGDAIRLQDVRLAVRSPVTGASALQVELAGRALAMASPVTEGSLIALPATSGRIDANVALSKLKLLPAGGLDWHGVDMQADVNLADVPTALVDHLASQQGRLVSLLGPQVTMTLAGQLPGDMDLRLQSPLSKVDGKLTITPQRVIHLRQDMAVELTPTAESVAVLGVLNPQLLALESARQPLSLMIRREDFTLPLPSPGQPLDLRAVHGELTLDLGEVTLRREGMVKDVFEVLAGFGGKFSAQQLMDVRFTPLEVRLSQGRIVTNDMWLISQDLVMGTQAQVDLNAQPSQAVVHLGISGQTLGRLPGARHNLPADFVADIKLAAPLSEIKVDKPALVVQLAPLFVTAYGGKEGAKVLDEVSKGVSQGIGLLDKLTGKERDKPAQTIAWPNHPGQSITTQPASDAAATTQPSPQAESSSPNQEEKEKKKEDDSNPAKSLFNRLKKSLK